MCQKEMVLPQPRPTVCDAESALYVRSLRLRLLQPVRHSHLAIHRPRGGQVLVRLVALAHTSVELAKTEVAVGDEGAHAARLGEGQRLAVLGLALLDVEPIGMGRDVAEKVQCMGREARMGGR